MALISGMTCFQVGCFSFKYIHKSNPEIDSYYKKYPHMFSHEPIGNPYNIQCEDNPNKLMKVQDGKVKFSNGNIIKFAVYYHLDKDYPEC